MAEPEKAAETAVASTESSDEKSTPKDAIYLAVADWVKEKTGKRIGKTGGRELFDVMTEQLFTVAAQEGAVRFNGGFGALHVRHYGSGSRRLPSGQTTTFGERQKLRYEEGVVVKALTANGGNLTEALKARGTREAKPAPDKKPTKEKAPAAAPKPAPAPNKAAATSGELNLD